MLVEREAHRPVAVDRAPGHAGAHRRRRVALTRRGCRGTHGEIDPDIGLIFGHGTLVAATEPAHRPRHQEMLDLGQADRVALVPWPLDRAAGYMVVPMLGAPVACIFVPRDVRTRVEQVVAVREGAHREADLLADEIEFGVIGHVADEAARREQHVPRDEARAQRRAIQLGRRDVAELEGRNALRRETIEPHPRRRGIVRQRPGGIIGRQIGGQHGPRRSAALGLIEQHRIPPFREAVMRIELQEPVFAVVQLHQFRPRPARTLALAPRHVDHAHPPAVQRGWWHLSLAMLPAHREAQLARPARPRHGMLDRRDQFGVAIGRNRDENRHVTQPFRSQ